VPEKTQNRTQFSVNETKGVEIRNEFARKWTHGNLQYAMQAW